jgi:hypothetical protein
VWSSLHTTSGHWLPNSDQGSQYQKPQVSLSSEKFLKKVFYFVTTRWKLTENCNSTAILNIFDVLTKSLIKLLWEYTNIFQLCLNMFQIYFKQLLNVNGVNDFFLWLYNPSGTWPPHI